MQKIRLTLAAIIVFALTHSVQAQMSTVGTPLRGANSSFFEHIGSSWGMNFKPRGNFGGGFLSFGGGAGATPPFGSFRPGAGITGGGYTDLGKATLFGRFNFSQGSSASSTSQTPVGTSMNGTRFFVGDVSQSPFVISVVPVVGGQGGGVFQDMGPANTIAGRVSRGEFSVSNSSNPVRQNQTLPPQPVQQKVPGSLVIKQDPNPVPRPAATNLGGGSLSSRGVSSAETAALSVAEIRAQQAAIDAARSAEANSIPLEYERAHKALKDGKPKVALIYFRIAAKKASSELREESLEWIKKIERGQIK